MRLRWKRTKKPTGLASVFARCRGSELHDGKTVFAWTYPVGGRPGSWYWVAREDAAGMPYKNTCNDPVSTEDEAKVAAMAYVKERLAKVVAQ